jgi:hypothetical protein
LKGYDEPEILPSQLTQFGLTGADAGHPGPSDVTQTGWSPATLNWLVPERRERAMHCIPPPWRQGLRPRCFVRALLALLRRADASYRFLTAVQLGDLAIDDDSR